jgi:two-component system NarL family sensor kinase
VTEGAIEKQRREAGADPTRFATRLAWALLVLSFALTVMSLWFLVLNLSHPVVHVYDFWVESTLAAIAFSTVGAVISPRLPPDNPIGWLFCVGGLLFTLTHFSGQYAIYTLLAEPGSLLPAGEAAAWLSSWFWVLQLGLIVFVVLLFPDGRLPGRAGDGLRGSSCSRC